MVFKLISNTASSDGAVPPGYHLGAMAVAAVLIFGVGIQDLDLQPTLGRFDDRYFRDYTPYFPGLNALEKHEIFSPLYTNTKKIVLLGGSAVDSIGCDSTWSKADKARQPPRNAAYACSIAGNMNEQLQSDGVNNWRVFNLARNGAALTPLIYVYARIAVLKPEIVIFGDPFGRMPFYLHDNAAAGDLRPAHYAYLDKIFGADDTTAGIWRSYRDTLIKKGLASPKKATPPEDLSTDFQPRQKTTLSDILVRLLTKMRNGRLADGPPLPIAFAPDYRGWDVGPYVPYAFENPDPGFGYLQGLRLIAELQKKHGGKLFVYFGPNYDLRNDLTYLAAQNDVFGKYLSSHVIPFASYIALDWEPVYETYDGSHGTLYGNRILAAHLLRDLREKRFIH